jgi:hypothetical protein
VVNFGPTGVVRCRHCRTYVNPFVQWVDNGRRWRCNLCGVSNDVPSSYFCHLGANQQRQDRDEVRFPLAVVVFFSMRPVVVTMISHFFNSVRNCVLAPSRSWLPPST